METSGGGGAVISKDRERKTLFDAPEACASYETYPGQFYGSGASFSKLFVLTLATIQLIVHQVHLGYRYNFGRPISELNTTQPLLLHTCANVSQAVNTVKLFHWRLGELFSHRRVLRGPVIRYNCGREYFEQTLILMDNVIPTVISHSRAIEGLRRCKQRTCENVNSGLLGLEDQQVQPETWRLFESLHS